MAPASSRLLFFERYNFVIRNGSSVNEEFERLARTRNWKRGSKSGKYEKAWRECFGDSLPVGTNVEEETEIVYLLHDLEDLDLQGRKGDNRQEQLHRVARQFGTYYGMDDRALESWQALCRDCGIDGELASIKKCKKVNVRASRMTVAHSDRR